MKEILNKLSTIYQELGKLIFELNRNNDLKKVLNKEDYD